MSTPVVKSKGVVLQSSDACPHCRPANAHLMSDHVVEKARQCTKCACVAQDHVRGGDKA